MTRKFTKYPSNYVRASRNWREKTECKTKNGKIVRMQNVSNIFNDVDYYVLYDANGNFVEKSLDFNDLHNKLYGVTASSSVKASSDKGEYTLTESGRRKAEQYVAELAAKRKEILDAGKDTIDETPNPVTVDDIISDLNWDGVDEDGEYCNGWYVTDNYDSDYPICLQMGEDFIWLSDINSSSSCVKASTGSYTDSQLEQMWLDLTDVPFDETEDGKLVLAEDWEQFPIGTDREDIWQFFDKNYSKGVAYLLYDFQG